MFSRTPVIVYKCVYRLKHSSKLNPFVYDLFSLRSPVLPKAKRKMYSSEAYIQHLTKVRIHDLVPRPLRRFVGCKIRGPGLIRGRLHPLPCAIGDVQVYLSH